MDIPINLEKEYEIAQREALKNGVTLPSLEQLIKNADGKILSIGLGECLD